MCPLEIAPEIPVLFVSTKKAPGSEPLFVSDTKFVKYVPTVPVKLVGVEKITGAEAPETASNAVAVAAVPTTHLRMMAKVDVAAGLVTTVRVTGITCNNAASRIEGL